MDERMLWKASEMEWVCMWLRQAPLEPPTPPPRDTFSIIDCFLRQPTQCDATTYTHPTSPSHVRPP